MNYSKGIISIPEVTGNIVINVTTQGVAQNLFDPNTSLYNYRIRGNGATEAVDGILVTNVIDIRNLSTITVSGVTEIFSSGLGYYAMYCTYSDSGATTKVNLESYSSATYTFDVAAIKAQYPSSNYLRLGLVLSASSISTADTTNLTIYGS